MQYKQPAMIAVMRPHTVSYTAVHLCELWLDMCAQGVDHMVISGQTTQESHMSLSSIEIHISCC